MKKLCLLFFIFLPLAIVAQNSNLSSSPNAETKKVELTDQELKSPRATMRTFLQAMVEVKKGNQNPTGQALKTLNLAHFDEATRKESGKLAAKHLMQTIDRLEFIKYEDIPNTTNGPPWVFRRQNVNVEGESHPVEIVIARNKVGNWRFTAETVENIKYFYQSLADKKIVKGAEDFNTLTEKIKANMPEWTGKKTFIFKNGQWIALFLLIFLCFVCDRLVRFIINKYVVTTFNKVGFRLSSRKRKSFTFPFGLMAFFGIWILGLGYLELSDRPLAIMLRIGYVLFTVGGVISAHHLVDVTSIYFEKMAIRSENKFDDLLVPLLRKSAKVFVVCIGAIFIGHSLTLNVTNIIAGLGIGGLAFALAAKDTLANLFGSLTVILDRPFQIGDWVLIDGKTEGTVIEVGFRSTRVRTFYDSLITVPNSQLTNVPIDNYGSRQYRRFKTSIGVEYSTSPAKIEEFCEGIRHIILNHPHTRKDYFHVYFNGMGDFSLNILLYVFWEVPDWSQELMEKHRLLIDILRLGKEMGINFAFPTQTLHLYQEQAVQAPTDPIDAYSAGKKAADPITNHSITRPIHRSSETNIRGLESN